MENPIRKFDADNQSTLKTRGDMVREITSRWVASSFCISGISFAPITKIPHLGETRVPSVKFGRSHRSISRRIASAIWLNRMRHRPGGYTITYGKRYRIAPTRLSRAAGRIISAPAEYGGSPKWDLLRRPNRRADQMSVFPVCQNPRKKAIA